MTTTKTAASTYQQLRGHLTDLKLADAADALPKVLDQAQAEGWTLTHALEQLLRIEVTATEARRLAGRFRFANLPTGANLDDFDLDSASGIDRSLLQELGTRRLWRTPSGIIVATDGGRVVATSGLPEVLAATRLDGPDPLEAPQALLDRSMEARRMIDLMRADREPDGMRFGVSVECRLRGSPTEDPGVLLVEERCRAGREGRFTNRYWVAAEGGAVLRAEQWVGPGVPMLALEFTPAS